MSQHGGWALAGWLATATFYCTCLPGCGLHAVELGPRASSTDEPQPYVVLGEVPSAAIERLRASPEEGADKGLELVYPDSAALAVPANLAPITFEWRQMGGPREPEMKPMAAPPDPGMDPEPAKPAPPKDPKAGTAMPGMPGADMVVYELIAHGDQTELRLYTLATHASFPGDRWRNLLRAHSGTVLLFTVRALRVQSGEILRTKPLELEVRAALPAGALYTWSTTAQGLGRAGIDSTREFYPAPPDTLAAPGTTHCVGCHAVSRDGRRILAAVGGTGRLWAWSLASANGLELGLSDATTDEYAFGSFDPTAARIAVTQGARLAILNADTGQLLQDTAWPMAMSLGYPDWSPDGRSIAIVMSAPKPAPDAAKGGSLARVPVALDGSLGAPEPIATGMMALKDETPMFPSYSPDGDWIVFEKRKGPARDAKDSSLWIVAAGGGEAVELMAATTGAKPAGFASAPSFIPGEAPGRAYVVFAARRAVGSFMPAEGQRQLFAAALDLPLAAAGKDPSHAPFWLPFQQRSSSYLRAQWAPAVSACSPSIEVCDDSDNDCDSQVDEDCCKPEVDVCDDQRDNDCDGQVDEGCGCTFQEQCGNGLDDDCDLQLDEMPCLGGPAGK
jgi:hypothetical protein